MSYLRYVSLLSIKKFCVGWKVKLHIPSKPGGPIPWKTGEQKKAGTLKENYFTQALEIADEVIRHDFSVYGFPNDAHEVHKADFLRWELLASEGGIWSDLDILYLKSIDCLHYSDPPNAVMEIDTIVHIYSGLRSHAIGFLGACPQNKLFKYCRDASREQSLTTYQAIGAELLNAQTRTMNALREKFPSLMIGNISQSCVYPILPIQSKIDFMFATDKPIFDDLSIGLHWFGGNPSAQAAEILLTGPLDVATKTTTFAKIIQSIIS
jgi:hypothetical protein